MAHAAGPAGLGATRPLSAALLPALGTTLVVAPHPDDESLGCGGLMALLHDAGQPVWALLVTDGTQSHPRSLRFNAAARQALRDAEWQAALSGLGVPARRRLRLGLPDGGVPLVGNNGFGAAMQQLALHLQRVQPTTIVLPWRRDPHPDHRASYALVQAALQHIGCHATAAAPPPPRQLEYAVWLAERASGSDWPSATESVTTWQLDIAAALQRKRQAIACHRSQLGSVIDDDPTGFVIAPAMRARAEQAVEQFFEVQPQHRP